MNTSSFDSPGERPGRVDVALPAFEIYDADDCRADDPVIEDLLAYFEGRTGGTRLPRRADFSPVDLKRYLTEICIMRPVYAADGALEDVIIQLMGTQVASFYGEVTGKSIFEHASPEVGARIYTSCKACVDAGRPIVAVAHTLSKRKDHLKVSVLYIPLAEDGERIDRFFVLVRVRSRGL